MENNGTKNHIQKLEDDDLQFSAGSTEARNASSFFKRDRVSTTCAYCGEQSIVKFDETFPTDMNGIYGYSKYAAEQLWWCPCGKQNLTKAQRWKGIGQYDTWWGTTYRVDLS